jgi:hypothetical protein
MDFAALPDSALHNYITTWDLIPGVQMAHSDEVSPLPATLLTALSTRATTPPAGGLTATGTVTPANRPRREVKEVGKRRTTRGEEDMRESTAVMADVEGVHQTLALLAERHFLSRPPPNEAEVIRNFFLAVDRSPGPGPSSLTVQGSGVSFGLSS